MEREGIQLSRFSFSEEKPMRTKLRMKPEKEKREKFDYSKYYIGFLFSTYIKEGDEKLASALQNWSLKDFGYGDGSYAFVVSQKSTVGVSYYGIGGLFTFCFEVAARFYYEGASKGMEGAKNQLLKYTELLMKILEEDGKKQRNSIITKHNKSSEAFVYISGQNLEVYIRNLCEFYYNIIQSKVEAGEAQFYEEGRKVTLISKESLIANEYDPQTGVNALEAYTQWLRAWVYKSADKSFILNIINGLKEEVIKFIGDNNLSENSPSEVKSSLFMKITTLANQILSGTANEDDFPLYKAFDKVLKLIVVKKGEFAYLLDVVLSKVKVSGVEGLNLLEEAVAEEIKILLAEESFEVSQLSTLFTEDIKACNLLKSLMGLIKEYSPEGALVGLNQNLSLKTLIGMSPNGVLSPVFQRVLDGLTRMGVEVILQKGVIYDIDAYNKYFGDLTSAFMGVMPPEDVTKKRKYLMSIPIKSEGETYTDHYDPMTVLDMLGNYPGAASLKKEKKLKAVIEINESPFSFSTSVGIMTSGELNNVHFPMSDEAYYYLAETVYSVIKDVYSNVYNSIEEIIYDTNRERTKEAFKLMAERGIFQKSMLGAFYFYRDKADKIIKSIYGNYYSIFFDWFFPMFGIVKAKGKVPEGKDVNVFDFGVDVGVGGYVGYKKKPDGTYKRWRGKGFGVIQKDILKEIDTFSELPKEEDRIRAQKPIARETEFSVLTGSIKNASRNLPYLFIEALTVKYGFYYLIEKKDVISKQLYRRIFLEAIDGDKFSEFKSEHKKEFDNPLDEWEAFSKERYVKALYTYTTIRTNKAYRGKYQKFSEKLRIFIENIPEILESRYLDSSGEITAEFLDLAFISIQAFGFSGKELKKAGIANNIPPYEDFSINDIENDIITRLADEVYKDKIVAITAQEDRTVIREEVKLKKLIKSSKRIQEKKEAEEKRSVFLKSFSVDEEVDETSLFDF